MRIPPAKIALVFGLVSLVASAHLAMAVGELGWTMTAVAPVVVSLVVLLGVLTALFGFLQRPVEASDETSEPLGQYWARVAPLLKILLPMLVSLKLVYVIAYRLTRE